VNKIILYRFSLPAGNRQSFSPVIARQIRIKYQALAINIKKNEFKPK
jgi:hypothetical protein